MSKAAELAALIGSQTAQSNRNLIINGAMNVAQRGTSSTGVGAAGSSGYHNLDRYRIAFSSTAGALTMSQSAVTDLPGFANCMKFDCTTADTSIAAAEFFLVQQRFEGQNVQLLKKGTSSAEPVTVSFYAKANANATYTLELADADNGRLNSQEFSVTTSWTRVSKTFVGDTTGTLDDDNAHSFQCNIWIHAGSTYTGGTHTSNVWQTVTNQRIGDNATSFFDSTDRTLEITGWQMEVGEVATPFEHRSFGDELRRCQRYYERYSGWTEAEATLLLSGRILSSNRNDACYFFRTKKRAVPSLTMISDNGSGGTSPSIVVFPSDATSETLSFISAAISGANTCSAIIRTTGGATLTNGHNSTTMMATDFAFDAEL